VYSFWPEVSWQQCCAGSVGRVVVDIVTITVTGGAEWNPRWKNAREAVTWEIFVRQEMRKYCSKGRMEMDSLMGVFVVKNSPKFCLRGLMGSCNCGG